MSISLKNSEGGSLIRLSIAMDFWIGRRDVFSLWRYSQTNSENTWVSPDIQTCCYCISGHTLSDRWYCHLFSKRERYKPIFLVGFSLQVSFVITLASSTSCILTSLKSPILISFKHCWEFYALGIIYARDEQTVILVMMVPSFLFIFNNPYEDTIVN